MLGQFKRKLETAQGRSEFVIAVVCDIRGFSSFATCHESPDTAMFIKRFYLRLLEEYFTDAAFAKPTGDGLLLIFRYSELNLPAVSENVLDTCFKVLSDFPIMFRDDPMINFSTPSNIGFGISRGPTCCLFSGRSILDYSGQLLNLASRLNDLARPKGIVIDGSYLEEVIPPSLRSRFKTEQVYLRGIVEDTPIDIFYSFPEVTVPGYALFPITSHEWEALTKEMTVSELSKLSGSFTVDLPKEPVSHDKTKLEIVWPHQKLQGYLIWREYNPYKIYKDAQGNHLEFSLNEAKNIVKKESLSRTTKISFRFQFVPKRKTKRKKRK